jgi:hypothetical protein
METKEMDPGPLGARRYALSPVARRARRPRDNRDTDQQATSGGWRAVCAQRRAGRARTDEPVTARDAHGRVELIDYAASSSMTNRAPRSIMTAALRPRRAR